MKTQLEPEGKIEAKSIVVTHPKNSHLPRTHLKDGIPFVCAVLVLLLFLNQSRADTILDISSSGSSSGTLDGVIYQQFNAKGGTGLIQSFLRIQTAKGTESGYNTGFPRNNFPSGFPNFDTKGGNFTVTVPFGLVPKVNVTGTDYRNILLDINENNNTQIDLTTFLVFIGGDLVASDGFSAGQAFHPESTDPVDGGALGDLVFDLDATMNNTVTMEDLFSGSGATDVSILLPETLFTGVSGAAAFRIFATFNNNHAGFEEFLIQGDAGGPGPGGLPIDPPNPSPYPAPEPTSLVIWLLLGLTLFGFGYERRRRHRPLFARDLE